MRIRERAFYVVSFLILSLIYIVSSNAASPKYAAKVNGVGIKNVALEAAVTNFIENQKLFGIDVKEQNKEQLQKDILEELISAELLYQKSKKAGLGDMKQEIDAQFNNIKGGFSSEQEFKDVLKERGVTQKELKEDIEKGVYIKAFLDRDIYKDITVTEAEKKEEYERSKDRMDIPEQVRARHILIRVAKDASDEDRNKAREKIDELRKRALSGEDFAELAKENSEDASAARGGDLGYFRKGDIVDPFEKVAFSLKREEISEVFGTEFGYHIIKLLDKQAAHTLSYDEVKEDIEMFLLGQRRREKLMSFVEDIRKEANIERF